MLSLELHLVRTKEQVPKSEQRRVVLTESCLSGVCVLK